MQNLRREWIDSRNRLRLFFAQQARFPGAGGGAGAKLMSGWTFHAVRVAGGVSFRLLFLFFVLTLKH